MITIDDERAITGRKTGRKVARLVSATSNDLHTVTADTVTAAREAMAGAITDPGVGMIVWGNGASDLGRLIADAIAEAVYGPRTNDQPKPPQTPVRLDKSRPGASQRPQNDPLEPIR